MKLKLFSEKIRPEGGATGQGIREPLGRPRLDPISTLIREAVQNSWDARTHESAENPVVFTARLGNFGGNQLDSLKESIFGQMPIKHPLKKLLKPNLQRLILEDRGTVGLCGPVFVERKPPTSNDRFINFCRMFGRASEGPIGGGTYGYGKSVYFCSSHSSTIIIHTRCNESGNFQERLIALSIWKTNDQDLDTGRYWWGVPSARHGGATGPAIGLAAAKLAKAIGFSEFVGNETGTSIMILAPAFQGALAQDMQHAARCIAETMVIWFWPRMSGIIDESGKLSFKVFCADKEVEVPNPNLCTPFSIYSAALKALIAKRNGSSVVAPNVGHIIRSEKPGAQLGYLALALSPRRDRGPYAICQRDEFGNHAIDEHVFAQQVDNVDGNRASCSHVALIRGPGQVIKYEQYRSFPDPNMEYCGVFLVDGKPDRDDVDPNDVNLAFAKAEPPAHDEWAPDRLENDWHKRYVRVAKKCIEKSVHEFTDNRKNSTLSDSRDTLGAISNELGELISAKGPGATPGRSQNVKGGRVGAGRGSIRIVIDDDDSTLEELGGKSIFVLQFRVESGNSEGETFKLKAIPRILVAGGGAESEVPIGDAQPQLFGWRARLSGRIIKDPILEIVPGEELSWQVLVEVPQDAVVGVSLGLDI